MSTEESSNSSTSSTTTTRSFDVYHQSVFITDAADEVGAEKQSVDDNDLLALDDKPFETSLVHYGVGVDTRQRTSRIDTGSTDEFVDDRPLSTVESTTNRSNGTQRDDLGLQGTLFADTTVGQQTLNGEQASTRFMFESE